MNNHHRVYKLRICCNYYLRKGLISNHLSDMRYYSYSKLKITSVESEGKFGYTISEFYRNTMSNIRDFIRRSR